MPARQTPPTRVTARRARSTGKMPVRAEVYTLGKRKAFMEQLEQRHILSDDASRGEKSRRVAS